jgi:hypothetical protein
MPRVKCDDCPCLNRSTTKRGNVNICNNGYEIKAFLSKHISTWRLNGRSVDSFKYSLCSDSCRLIKIVTRDGEIYPEPAEDSCTK